MHAVVRLSPLLTCLAVPALVNAGTAYITADAGEVYGSFALPGFAPPVGFFEVAWMILCLLMGVSSYLIYTARGISRADRNSALSLYGFALLSGCIWNILFFRFGLLGLSALWVVVVFMCHALCTALFYRIRAGAGVLMAPSLAWMLFVGVLCFSIAALN